MANSLNISPLLVALDTLCPSGYAIALHIRFNTPVFLFQTYEKSWIDIYSTRGYLMQDPTVMWGFQNIGSCHWSDLAHLDEGGVLKDAAAHGLNFGFVHALERDNSRSMASFTRQDRNFDESEIAEITAILDKLHDATRETDQLAPDDLAALKALSITLTHDGKPVS